jgi:hypothetical protein
MKIYNRIKTEKRKKLFLLFLRFLKDNHLISKFYNVKTTREVNISIDRMSNLFNDKDAKATDLFYYIDYYYLLNMKNYKWEEVLVKHTLNISRTEFIENFFKQNKLLKEYYVNLKKSKRDINNSQLIGLVSNSFTWSDTPQGHSFWRKVDDDFNEYVNENINKKYE